MRAAAVLALVALALAGAASAALVNKDVRRKIDVSTQFVRHSVAVTLENDGKGSEATFDVLHDSKRSSGVFAFIAAEVPGAEKKKASGGDDDDDDDEPQREPSTPLRVQPHGAVDAAGVATYRVTLAQPLAAGATIDVEISLTFSHAMTPLPAEIKQADSQLVTYEDSAYFFSPYATTQQVTTIQLATPSVESYTDSVKVKKSKDQLTYGPFKSIAARSFEPIRLHFENNSPFATFTEVAKEVEVSHWGGNLAVEMVGKLRNDGAKHHGPWSRMHYQRNPKAGQSALRSLKQALPLVASDIYYRDVIGNISTSDCSVVDGALQVEIRPRYPLFGGWATEHKFGYNLPLSRYLSRDTQTGEFVLRFMLSETFDNAVIDRLYVRVVLPEGATDVRVSSPMTIERLADEKRATFLDTFGRPVIVLAKSNVVLEHSKDANGEVEVRYRFSTMAMMREPVMLIGGFFAFFVVIMVVSRLRFTIGGEAASSDAANGAKIAQRLQQIVAIHGERREAFVRFERVPKSNRRQVDTMFKTELLPLLSNAEEKVRQLQGELAQIDESGDVAARVADCEATFAKVVDLQKSAFNNELNFAEKKIEQLAYEDLKQRIAAQLDILRRELALAVADLAA